MSVKSKLAKSAFQHKVSRYTRSPHFWVNLLAIGLLLFIAAIGVMNIDPSWNAQAYHLPVAARLAGIFSRDEYRMAPMVEGYFDGNANLAELVQGGLWRLSGLPGAANLVGILSMTVLIVVSSAIFKIPIWQLTIFYLSIPLVLRHSYSSYVDLAANAFLCLAMVIFFSTIMKKDHSIRKLILVLIPLAVAANIKLYQLVLSVVLECSFFFHILSSGCAGKCVFRRCCFTC